MPHDLEPFIRWVRTAAVPALTVAGPVGSYRRRVDQDDVDLYGSADLVCVRAALDDLPGAADRHAWAAVIGDFQDPVSGWFVERGPATHLELHVAAYAQAALVLLDAEPPHPLAFLDRWADPASVEAFLDGLDWSQWVYLESHRGAGLGALVANDRGRRDPAWFAAYRGALDRRLDPANGMYGVSKPPAGDRDQIGGTFHYAFVLDWLGWPLAHPERRIDAVLGLQDGEAWWDRANPFWLTLDAVYLLTRAVERCDHRRAEVHVSVGRAVEAVLELAVGTERGRRAAFLEHDMGSHNLAAVLSLLAEAQRLLGRDEVQTAWPLRQVLDRRPFI